METADLREGNFVYEETLGLCKVVGTHKDSGRVWLRNDSGIEDKVMKEFIKPIPINEDWVYHRFTTSLKENSFGLTFIGNRLYVRIKGVDFVALDYVHQYQNLYHILINDELTR